MLSKRAIEKSSDIGKSVLTHSLLIWIQLYLEKVNKYPIFFSPSDDYSSFSSDRKFSIVTIQLE